MLEQEDAKRKKRVKELWSKGLSFGAFGDRNQVLTEELEVVKDEYEELQEKHQKLLKEMTVNRFRLGLRETQLTSLRTSVGIVKQSLPNVMRMLTGKAKMSGRENVQARLTHTPLWLV